MTLRQRRNNEPLVSCITIFLNAERFIEEAIESVLAQTYDNWELLLVDDGSTDDGTAIALRYAQKYPGKVRYLEHPGHRNLGMSASRNLGVRHAGGEYVAFLDADDVWLPLKLEEQVAILGSHPEVAMLYGRTRFWFAWTGNPEDAERDYLTNLGVEPDTLVKPPTLLTLTLRDESTVPSTCSVLVRREVLEGLGGFDETFREMYEDMIFYAKISFEAPVFVSGGCWDKYRQHPDKSCSFAQEKGEWHPFLPNPARGAYLRWLAGYLSERGAEGAGVWKVLQRELWPYDHPTLYRPVGLVKRLVRFMEGLSKSIARLVMPASIHRRLRARWRGHEHAPSPGEVRFGNLRRATPVSPDWGYDRGLPVDRYYIERFLALRARDVRGRALEIEDATYTRRFGGDRVTTSDVLHVVEGNPEATIIGDLTSADHIPSNTFDCIILTQTLHLIYDVRAAIETLHRILKPGGVALITFPAISQVSHYGAEDEENWSDYWCWGLTALSARRMVEEVFGEANVEAEAYGNVLTATSLLYGLAAEELRRGELDHRDPDYDVIVGIRAVKRETT